MGDLPFAQPGPGPQPSLLARRAGKASQISPGSVFQLKRWTQWREASGPRSTLCKLLTHRDRADIITHYYSCGFFH